MVIYPTCIRKLRKDLLPRQNDLVIVIDRSSFCPKSEAFAPSGPPISSTYILVFDKYEDKDKFEMSQLHTKPCNYSMGKSLRSTLPFSAIKWLQLLQSSFSCPWQAGDSLVSCSCIEWVSDLYLHALVSINRTNHGTLWARKRSRTF